MTDSRGHRLVDHRAYQRNHAGDHAASAIAERLGDDELRSREAG